MTAGEATPAPARRLGALETVQGARRSEVDERASSPAHRPATISESIDDKEHVTSSEAAGNSWRVLQLSVDLAHRCLSPKSGTS